MCAQLGIDKLNFWLPGSDVKFSPDFPATIQTPWNAATGETSDTRTLYMAGDRPVPGSKAFYNTRDYNLSIAHNRDSSGPFVTVHFSAGAFSESNLEPLDRDRIMDVTQLVQRDLAEKGARLNLSAARVTRVDIAQNVKLARPVACYAPALQALGVRKRVRKMDFGGTGFITGNKQWEIGFYDKGAQMKELDYPVQLRPENTVRPELRLMKGGVIRDALGCSTVSELHTGWSQVKPVYITFMERDVFRPKLESKMGASIDVYDLAHFVRDSDVARPWQLFKSELAMMVLIESLGPDLAKHFVASQLGIDTSTESGRRQIDRINAEIDRATFALKVQGITPEGHQIVELYDELKDRVLRLAA